MKKVYLNSIIDILEFEISFENFENFEILIYLLQ